MPHFNSTISTLTYAVQLTRLDGTIFGMTSLNYDFVIDGVTFAANSAAEPTAVTQKVNLATDNISLKALITSDLVTPEELLAGLYENAEVVCAFVDFTDLPAMLADGIVLLKGRVGAVEVEDGFFTFEIRSLSEELNRPLVNKASTQCPYDFGDFRCKKNLVADSLQISGITITSSVGNIVNVDTALATTFVNGTIQLNSGTSANKIYEIAGISGLQITLTELVGVPLEAGDTLTATAFCEKSEAACIFYNNHVNFGGFLVGGNFMPGLTVITTVN